MTTPALQAPSFTGMPYTVYLCLLNYYTGFKSETSKWKRCVRQGMERVGEGLRCPFWVCPPPSVLCSPVQKVFDSHCLRDFITRCLALPPLLPGGCAGVRLTVPTPSSPLVFLRISPILRLSRTPTLSHFIREIRVCSREACCEEPKALLSLRKFHGFGNTGQRQIGIFIMPQYL